MKRKTKTKNKIIDGTKLIVTLLAVMTVPSTLATLAIQDLVSVIALLGACAWLVLFGVANWGGFIG